jgi:translocation and assembly module TamB
VSSVVIRAALHGQASAPELELTSVPALEESDILSLLLFNQPANELATSQRNELAIQAATLASGFVVSPAVSAMGEKLGLDFLQLEPNRHIRRNELPSERRAGDLEGIVSHLRA